MVTPPSGRAYSKILLHTSIYHFINTPHKDDYLRGKKITIKLATPPTHLVSLSKYQFNRKYRQSTNAASQHH